VITQNEFSLRRLSLSSLVWFGTVIAGWALLLVGVVEVVTTPGVEMVAPLVMTAVLLVLLELLPLIQGRGHDPQGVVMSTAFTCALVIMWGIWPAVLLVGIASLAADLRAKKAWWKTVFNPAQYALSVGAGFLVILSFADRVPTLAHPMTQFALADMTWVVGTWVAYYVINLLLVAGVVSWMGTFRSMVVDDFWHVTAMTFAVMALSPLLVVVAQTTWSLLPLLLIPLLLLYVTAQMSLAREHAAGHDVLTGLPNRATFQFELDSAFERSTRGSASFGLMLIDLDDFKRVNDTLGHQIGDALLVRFAERLQQGVRPLDHVARLGGDEFAVLVFDADEDEVRSVAERIRETVLDPIVLDGLSLDIDLSVGIAMSPDHGLDGTVLLQRADVAMYVAKEARTGIEIYSPERDMNSTDRLGLLSELRQALDDDVLELHYQPKVSPETGALMGVEALLRWKHPVRGHIPPDAFIPLAEGSGIMPLLTERVIGLALTQMARWRDAGLHVPVAVNIAPTDLAGDRLSDLIETSLRELDLPAAMLKLEITERIITHDLEDAKETLQKLRAMGVTISLDDFGTEYSSLQRLSSLPVDEIKIDRAFVSRLSDGRRAVGIVRALVDLAHALDIPAIAEGVETAEEQSLLTALGCDGVQGWHVATPMSAEPATQWLREHQAVSRLRASGLAYEAAGTPVAEPASSDLAGGLPADRHAVRLHRGSTKARPVPLEQDASSA
jgi:diguanylate cyclase (GGDEF)-like protein